MKTQTILILSLFFFLGAEAQPYTGKSFDKKQAEQLIVGQWQHIDISVTCDQIKGFNEAMNDPIVQAGLKSTSDAMSSQFDSGGRLIATVFSKVDTAQYQITDDGYFLIYTNIKNTPPGKKKILQLNSDTLIFTYTRKANTPDMLELLSTLDAEKDSMETITYTFTLTKVKEANAPWTFIKSDLPQNRWIENLVADDSTFFTLVSDPDRQNDDSIYTSNNDCINWSYGGYAIPKSEEVYNKIIKNIGSKVLVKTAKSVFATENKGRSWSQIRIFPTDVFGMGLPEFGTTATGIYAGFESTLLASSDNGVTWDSVKTPLQNEFSITTLAAGGNNVIIGGIAALVKNASDPTPGLGAFLLLSTDDGQTWKDIQLTSNDYPGLMTIGVAIVGSFIFMRNQLGIFRSDLQQINWTPVKGLSVTLENNAFSAGEPTGNVGETILASGTNIFYGGEPGMFVSDNGGESWKEVNNKDLRKGVNSFVIVNDRVIVLTAESKLFKASVADLVQYTKTNGK